jgi:hypothetical protein
MRMSNREKLQCGLLALSASLFVGSIASGVTGNIVPMVYTLAGGHVVTGLTKLLDDERDELIKVYKRLASTNPDELSTWMDTLTDGELEYLYNRVTQS